MIPLPGLQLSSFSVPTLIILLIAAMVMLHASWPAGTYLSDMATSATAVDGGGVSNHGNQHVPITTHA
jgi:hypothetical protein